MSRGLDKVDLVYNPTHSMSHWSMGADGQGKQWSIHCPLNLCLNNMCGRSLGLTQVLWLDD